MHYTARHKEGPSEKSGAVVEGFPLLSLSFFAHKKVKNWGTCV